MNPNKTTSPPFNPFAAANTVPASPDQPAHHSSASQTAHSSAETNQKLDPEVMAKLSNTARDRFFANWTPPEPQSTAAPSTRLTVAEQNEAVVNSRMSRAAINRQRAPVSSDEKNFMLNSAGKLAERAVEQNYIDRGLNPKEEPAFHRDASIAIRDARLRVHAEIAERERQ